MSRAGCCSVSHADAISPLITDSGMRVVLDEYKTPKDSWDAKPDKEYLASVRELEDDSEYDPYTGMPVGPHVVTNEETKKQ